MTAHDDGGVEDWSEQLTNGSAERTEQVPELESPNARKAASGMEGKGIIAVTPINFTSARHAANP